jgi:hypothetical protein
LDWGNQHIRSNDVCFLSSGYVMELDKATITLPLGKFKELYNFAIAADTFIRGLKQGATDYHQLEKTVTMHLSTTMDAEKAVHLKNEIAALNYAGQKPFF